MNNELLSIISYLERDRGVNREVIIQAIETAIQQAARKNLNTSNDFKVTLDRKTLRISAYDVFAVSDEEHGPGILSVKQARRYDKNVQEGDTVKVPMQPEALGRIAAQTAKQAILQKIREAERKNVFEEYKDRVGDIVTGTVKLITHRDLIVELGKTEAILPYKERIPTEEYNVGDCVRAYVQKVQNSTSGPAIQLSRACPEFVKALFRLEVSEIADGIVEVMGVSRDPGFRAKIAVKTLDPMVDPVGACVGMRGARVRNIVRELNGEKIDIVRWNENIRTYVAEALSPAKLESIEVDDASHSVHVTVPPEQLSLAIGKRGQNVRLATRLTGWRVSIDKTAEIESFAEQRETVIRSLEDLLDITTEDAEMLVENGFLTPEGIVATELPYFQEVTGLDEDTARVIWLTAQEAVKSGEDGE